MLWWLLPYINMNQPQLYMCPLHPEPPPTSLPTLPSGLSQSTNFGCPTPCPEPALNQCFSNSPVAVQLPSHVQLFATPWTTARQASLSVTNSRSPPKPMSIESVMPSNHLILWHPLLLLSSIFSSIRDFSSESLFTADDQNTGASASASVLPVNI